MLYYLLTTLYVFVCLVLLLVILLQQGKGGDMASAFGGASSQTAFGARSGATLLSKLTTAFDLTWQEIEQLVSNAVMSSFAPMETRRQILQQQVRPWFGNRVRDESGV